MRRLPGLLLITGAAIVVIVALAVSGLRLALPQIDSVRPQIQSWVQTATGVPVAMDSLTASWQSFGPTLEINNLRATPAESDWQVERITLALDVWQSLLHARWQFRDLTFHRMDLTLNATLTGQRADGSLVESDRLSTLFLQQFDHFDVRDSRISFLTPSGDRAELAVPQLTWLNARDRHRAEGLISLSSFNGQHGVVQVRMDLRDVQGRLDDGTVYLQADNIDMKPWISRWLKSSTGLESANFNLAAWLHVRDGNLYASDAFLKQGTATWREGEKTHALNVDNLTLHTSRQGDTWQVSVPALNLATDGKVWPKGTLAASWLPEKDELRIRASQLSLVRLKDVLPLLSSVTPELKARWQQLQPEGLLSSLALDIPLKQPMQTRFQAAWRDLSWHAWEWLPGGDKVSGTLDGSVERGRLTLDVAQTVLPQGNQFRAPLAIEQVNGVIDWRNAPDGWALWSDKLDVRARSLQANGNFHYAHPAEGEPRLDILAGMRLTDAADAWRYFPEPLMGNDLATYLTRAIKGGHVDNATLVFAGNPAHFPFEKREGQFQVWVPLRDATFEFEPGWPLLSPLDIDLNFSNDGLLMLAPHVRLGNVDGKNIQAAIPDYSQEKLLIDGELDGSGLEVGRYFDQTPLKSSVGSALQQLQIGGDVKGTLHLDIPLSHGGEVTASGDIQLNNNSLYIKPLKSTLNQLNGKFSYRNGVLNGNNMTANWLGQPIAFDFNTQEQSSAFLVNVGLNGDWEPARLPGLPKPLQSALSGSTSWQTRVAVQLPHKGTETYDVEVQADLKKVSARLPSPLNKAQGEALPLTIKAKGDMHGFQLSGRLGKSQQFNSQWLLKGDTLSLARASWLHDAAHPPALPEDSSFTLDLPALDGEGWLALGPALRNASAGRKPGAQHVQVPEVVQLRTPALQLLGQRWHDVTLTGRNLLSGSDFHATGREIDATLTIPPTGMWHTDIRYLYYNPQWKGDEATNPIALAEKRSPLSDPSIRFDDWPALQLACEECWVAGQKLGKVQATLQPEQDKLTLSDGLIDTGKATLTASGSWQENADGVRTALKGRLKGGTLEQNADWFGVDTPLRATSFDVDYDLYWRGSPWAPNLASLSGILHSQIGKGSIANIGTGQAGQLLRLVSFDALLRKLQFDFSDTFGKGFYFDSIRSTAWIKDGVLHTDDLLVDGLEADIAMKGSIDLANRRVDMEAVIAPEISATVGVATAFVVNPVVGAAVFAASKVLAPLWNKISLIRYQINGSLDQPTIKEILREPQKNAAQGGR